MEIENVKIENINPAPYNPRIDLKPGDPRYDHLKKSLDEFGYVDPIIWNRSTGNLVGGHQRLKILIEKGQKEVEASVVALSPEREKALNIALNKNQGDWDDDKLATLLRELSNIPDFSMELTGFEQSEIDTLFDRVLNDGLGNDGDSENSAGTGGTAVTPKGEVIQLGSHRLLCGDASNVEDLLLLIGDQKIALLYCDPPYNCRYDAKNRPTADQSQTQWQAIQNDDMQQAEYEAWLQLVLGNVKPFLAVGAPAYIWNGHRQFGPMHSILTGFGFHVSNVITWVKPCPTPGYADYRMQSEFCLYAWLHDNGAHRWYGPNDESNVWEVNRDPAVLLIHPTQKPIALAQRAMKNSSQRRDVILDPFAGSGSTLIAAQHLDRACYCMEIDPAYCDAIVRRYIKEFGSDGLSDETKGRYLK